MSVLGNLIDAGRLDIDEDGNVTDPRDGQLPSVTLPGWDDPMPIPTGGTSR
jgi:hypothetical protein